jgi:hypothetical protein
MIGRRGFLQGALATLSAPLLLQVLHKQDTNVDTSNKVLWTPGNEEIEVCSDLETTQLRMSSIINSNASDRLRVSVEDENGKKILSFALHKGGAIHWSTPPGEGIIAEKKELISVITEFRDLNL